MDDRSPWFAFFGDDFAGATIYWTDAQVGRYIRLLIMQWGSGAAQAIQLPPDTDPIVAAKFAALPDGTFRNNRLHREWSAAQARSNHGRRANAARWSGRVPGDSPGTPRALPGQSPNDPQAVPPQPHPQPQSLEPLSEASETDQSVGGWGVQGGAPAAPRTAARAKKAQPKDQEAMETAKTWTGWFNLAHKRNVQVTAGIVRAIAACLKADPPYPREALFAAAVMSGNDEWYGERDPSMVLRFKGGLQGEGKRHLDDLLARVRDHEVPPAHTMAAIKADPPLWSWWKATAVKGSKG